jgi:hypothetical protein
MMVPRSSVDDYLTRIARQAWPTSSVTVRTESNGSKTYTLHVPDEKPCVIGNAFGPAKALLRAIVFQHLPPEANRAAFTFEMRVIDDARKPPGEDLARASRIGASLVERSTSRSDAVLAGKLLQLGLGGGAFTLEDVRVLRRLAEVEGERGDDFKQLADAIARWCQL